MGRDYGVPSGWAREEERNNWRHMPPSWLSNSNATRGPSCSYSTSAHALDVRNHTIDRLTAGNYVAAYRFVLGQVLAPGFQTEICDIKRREAAKLFIATLTPEHAAKITAEMQNGRPVNWAWYELTDSHSSIDKDAVWELLWNMYGIVR